MRDRKRNDRLVKPRVVIPVPFLEQPVKPKSNLTVRPAVKPNGLIMDGNRIVGVKPKDTGYPDMSNPAYAKTQEGVEWVLDAKPGVQPKTTIPLYDPTKHAIGDTVLIKHRGRTKEVTIPELDADGNAIYT